ncbi:MAG: tRNA (5-methylaminomethyl-2-thiouridine)(34)-methyltransferase MnmD [Pseudomonadales bacterium]
MYTLEAANIEWRGDEPYSTRFGDIYWSHGNPANEKQHVFVDQHNIETRGKNASHFTIVETGFGFGNNFLLTANRWRECQHEGILHYISIENTPVKREDLARHFASYPLPYSSWLLRAYPPLLHTTFNLWLGKNIRLQLIFDDAAYALQHLDASVDAWYLDGFSPKINTDLWNPRIYGRIHALSKPGASLSTYTVAGHVRQGLTNAGFQTEKSTGFGRKAEMLVGKKPGQWVPATRNDMKIAVLGSGVAGISCVAALQRRHLNVECIGNDDPNGASKIPLLAIYPQLGLHNEGRYQFSIAASNYVLNNEALNDNVLNKNAFNSHTINTRVLSWHSSDITARERMQKIAAQLPDDYLESQGDSVLYHQAGTLSLSPLDERIFRRANIGKIKRIADQWAVFAADGTLITQVDQLIIAMGIHTSKHLNIPILPLRGQALTVNLGQQNPPSLRRAIIGDLTIIPGSDNNYCIGSTFQRSVTNVQARDSDTLELLNRMKEFVGVEPEVISTHVGIRATTRDRLPLVGRVPNWDQLSRHSVQRDGMRFDHYQRGLYVCTGFGSHGASHAGLCGEQIANYICGEPGALPEPQQHILSLERFHLRDSRPSRNRGKRHG